MLKPTFITKFGQLVLEKTIEIVATRCHVLRLKRTKFDFRWGYVPDSDGELTGCKFNQYQ